MVACVAENDVPEYHARVDPCRNRHLLAYALTDLHPVAQHLLVLAYEPFALIGRVDESP